MNKVLDYCYHSHTFRCGHASGLDEEYVVAAKNIGLKTLGFSDHVMIPGLRQTGIRGQYIFLDDYVHSVNYLKKKYKGQIDVKLAFECEWYGGKFVPYYKELLEKRGFDYLILGEHCRINEIGQCYWYGLGESSEDVLAYADSVVAAIKSGLFLYVAHADLFMIWYHSFDKYAEEACRRIAKASVEYDVPLELNCGSLRRDALIPGREDEDAGYPKRDCWKIFAEYGCKCVIGYDAHNPSEFKYSLERNVPYLFKMIDDLGLNFISNDELLSKMKK